MVGKSATTVQVLEQRAIPSDKTAQSVPFQHFVSLRSHYPYPLISTETVMVISERDPAKVRFVRNGMSATLSFQFFDGIRIRLQDRLSDDIANVRNNSPTYHIDAKIMSRRQIASKKVLGYTTDYFTTGEVFHRHVPVTSKDILDHMSRERLRKAIMQRNGRFTALTGNDRLISSSELCGAITMPELKLLREEGTVVHLLRYA